MSGTHSGQVGSWDGARPFFESRPTRLTSAVSPSGSLPLSASVSAIFLYKFTANVLFDRLSLHRHSPPSLSLGCTFWSPVPLGRISTQLRLAQTPFAHNHGPPGSNDEPPLPSQSSPSVRHPQPRSPFPSQSPAHSVSSFLSSPTPCHKDSSSMEGSGEPPGHSTLPQEPPQQHSLLALRPQGLSRWMASVGPHPIRSCSISSIFSARAITLLMISFSSSVNSSCFLCLSG